MRHSGKRTVNLIIDSLEEELFGETLKVCPRCGDPLPISKFPKSGGWCKACMRSEARKRARKRRGQT